MVLLTHSQQIMHLSIAVGVLLIAFFLAWILFYIAMIIKDARSIINKTKDTLSAAHATIKAIKTKIDETSVQFKFVLEGIKTIMDWVKNKHQENKDTSYLNSDKDGKKEK